MTQVINDYEVNPRTMALIPARNIDYQTIVLESGRKIHVTKSPLQLIKEACRDGGATYEGRYKAVTHKTGIHKKVPIPISQLDQIYAFPTHSAKQFNCHWIFYHHLKAINLAPHKKSIITFCDHQELEIEVSAYVLKQQMLRTAHCFLLFSKSHSHQPFQTTKTNTYGDPFPKFETNHSACFRV